MAQVIVYARSKQYRQYFQSFVTHYNHAVLTAKLNSYNAVNNTVAKLHAELVDMFSLCTFF